MIAWAGRVPRAMPAVTKDIVSNDAQGRAQVWLLRCGRAAAQSWASLAWDGREHDLYHSDDFEGGILVICISVDFEGGIETRISFFLVICIKIRLRRWRPLQAHRGRGGQRRLLRGAWLGRPLAARARELSLSILAN